MILRVYQTEEEPSRRITRVEKRNYVPHIDRTVDSCTAQASIYRYLGATGCLNGGLLIALPSTQANEVQASAAVISHLPE